MTCFVQAGQDGPVKIGSSARSPQHRMAEAQTFCPDELRLILTLPGGLDRERRLHARFRHAHIRGEWFRPTVALTEYIRAMRGGL